MNKITVKGSKLAALVSFLRSKVTLHEGVNLDENVFQLVKDEKGVVYLRGFVRQPSHCGYICKNISEGDEEVQGSKVQEVQGSKVQGVQGVQGAQGTQEGQVKSTSVRAAFDANAVAGEQNECYSMSSTMLGRMLASIGDDEAVFCLDGNGLVATVGGAKYKLDAKLLTCGLYIPTYTVLNKHPEDGSYYPLLSFEVKTLLEMLETVIPLSKATSRSPMLKGRAIHMVLEQGNNGNEATFESVSATAGIRIRKRQGFSFIGDIDEQFDGTLHLAIDKAAAESLYGMVKGEGKRTVFAHDVANNTLIAWCGSHTISITIQAVSECDFPENEMTTGFNVDRLVLLAMLANVRNTGSSTVCVTVQADGILVVGDPDGMYSATVSGCPSGFSRELYRFTLPLSTLIADVKSLKSKFMNLYFDDSHPMISICDSANGIDGAVMKL